SPFIERSFLWAFRTPRLLRCTLAATALAGCAHRPPCLFSAGELSIRSQRAGVRNLCHPHNEASRQHAPNAGDVLATYRYLFRKNFRSRPTIDANPGLFAADVRQLLRHMTANR